MESLYTIFTFSYPSEAYPLRSLLESEGIPCYLKDEINVQINPLGSNALGGVKLQVKAGDVKAAIELMDANGYSIPKPQSTPVVWQKFDSFTGDFPLIGKMEIVYRFLFISAILLLLVILLLLKFVQ